MDTSEVLDPCSVLGNGAAANLNDLNGGGMSKLWSSVVLDKEGPQPYVLYSRMPYFERSNQDLRDNRAASHLSQWLRELLCHSEKKSGGRRGDGAGL